MLGKPSRRTRENLEQNGRHAEAVVLEISEKGMAITHGADTVVGNTELAFKTHLRVEPEGELPFEVKQRFRYPQLAVPSAGSRLSVIFDPDDHDHIMIDRSLASHKVGKTDAASLLATTQAFKADPDSTPQELAAALMAQLGMEGRQAKVIIGGEQISGALSAAGLMAAATSAEDPVDKLEKLARLRDAGVLNEQEFQTQKTRILGEST